MLKSFARTVFAVMLLMALSPAARADGPSGGVAPCENSYICVGVTEPPSAPAAAPGPSAGSGGGDGGTQLCSWNGQQWPCWDDDLGWFNTSDGCYYHRSDPQPPADDPAWGGNAPSTGAVYEVNCRGVGGELTPKPPMFFAQPPGGPPPPDRPYDLGMTAVRMIHFDAPELHTAPAGTAVVGMPVWLWYIRTPTTGGPQSATAHGRTLSVTATATLTGVHWDTGDGGGTDCTDPGTPYLAGATRPSCGYTYHTSSAGQPGTDYYLTATMTWHIEAHRSDNATQVFGFDYTVSTAQPLPLKVAEVQVLN